MVDSSRSDQSTSRAEAKNNAPPIVDQRELVSAIRLPPAAEMPQIILSVSPCRSGTTVMLRVFGALGVESHFQPLKNVLRWRLEGTIQPWQLTAAAGQTVFIKETLGPYTLAESTFNPLQLLLAAGVPPEKLHILIQGRHPLATWASWRKWWQGRTNLDLLVASYHTTEQIYQQAIRTNLPVTTLVYEAFEDHPSATVVKQLAQRMKIAYHEGATTDWDKLPAFGAAGSNVRLPHEPDRFITSAIHDPVHTATAFVYHTIETEDWPAMMPEERQHIDDAGLLAIYAQWRDQCSVDLAL